MKTKWIFAVVILVLGSFLVSKAQPLAEKGKAIDNESLAQRLVNQCAAIHEGEIVLITGGVRDFELLEDIAVNVRKLGAFPLLTMGSDRIIRRLFTDVPVKYDAQVPELDLKLFSFVTAMISVDFGETSGLLADIPPGRFVAKGDAYKPVNELLVKRNIKIVNLGNGLYPSEANAKMFGLTQKELSEIFWAGVNVDYPKLETKAKALKTILAAGKEVHITNANGTDLKVRIENRPVLVSDGVLTADDIKKGYAASQVYLPAGEVFLTPVPGTAEGKVVIDRQFYQDKEIIGLMLTFKAGKLISMTAKSGLDPLKAMYDAAEPGKDELAFIDFGINPDIRIKPGSKLVAWMPAGMITVGIGNNVWAGGENKVPFSLPCFLPGSTIKIDGKALVENGILKD